MWRYFILLLLLTSVATGKCRYNYITDIPDNARVYLPTLYEQAEEVMPGSPYPGYFGALVELESCVSLCSRRCWTPKARLLTHWDKAKKIKREEGAGLAQLTRAYKRDGRLRFDIIHILKRSYPKQLKELNWDNVYDRPDLQMKAMILLWKSNFMNFSKTIPIKVRYLFADSMYNGGSRLLKERKLCKLKKGCDPDKWYGNVELMNARGNRILYGKRTAHMINRDHVRIAHKKSRKYCKDYQIRYKKKTTR